MGSRQAAASAGWRRAAGGLGFWTGEDVVDAMISAGLARNTDRKQRQGSCGRNNQRQDYLPRMPVSRTVSQKPLS
jgi:hypothetical protein